MSNHELNSGSEINSGLDAALGLPGSHSNLSRDLFGQPLSKTPTALGNLDHPSLKTGDNYSDGTDQADPLTGLPSNSVSGHGYEFESGIAPIDYTVHLAGKALDAVDQVIESSTPVVKKVVHDAVTQISETVHDSIDTAQKNWNAPDNELRTTLNHRFNQAIGFAKQKITDLSADPDVQEAVNITTRLGRTVAERTKNFIETAQSVTESWVDKAFDSSYLDESLSTTPTSSGSSESPFVGVIDTNFKPQSHGAQVADTIQQAGHRPDWLGDGVGTGQWTDSLVQFVDVAKASGRSGAIVNLSFDLTQINPDGSVSTRFELTAEEKDTLKYAQDNGVLVVVSAGNQDGAMSALGQASQDFDNVIAVGATEGRQRADYSSYGAGLDVVTSSQGTAGTSLAAARVTGAIARIWDTNPQLNYRQVIQALESTATDLHKPGWDSETGFGQLNTSAALDLAEDLSSQSQGFANSLTSQNPVQGNQADQDLHNGIFERESLVWQESNGAIPSERPNRVIEGTGLETVPASNIANSPSSGSSPLDHLLKYELGVPLQYDEQVKQWQQRMSDLGYEIDVDGFYGEQSAGVARQFQTDKGLADDGIVGPDTWAVSFSTTATTASGSDSASSSTLDQAFRHEPGSLTYNPDVERWQRRMSERGWNIAVDGFYGEESDRIARQFQQEKGLTVDGIVGPQTWAAAFDTTNVTTGSGTASTPNLPEHLPGLSSSNATQALLDAARSYIGVREQGENRGPEVERFQSLLNGAQAEAWCMSFVQYCINAAEGTTQSDSSVVRSEGCVDVWNRSPASLKHSRPEVGSLVIWQDVGKTTGHVGIVESVNSDGSFTTIEGNTTDDRGTEAEGVHRRHRTMADTSKRVILGFLKVFPGDELSSSVASDTSNSSTLPAGEVLKYEAGQPLMQGEHVREWQEFLNKQGYNIAVDGVYGEESADATRRFQQSQGIADDGIVGEETIATAKNNESSQVGQTETISRQPSSQKDYESLYAREFYMALDTSETFDPFFGITTVESQPNHRATTWGMDDLYGLRGADEMLKQNQDFVIQAAQHYGIDGRAIAGAIRWEYERNYKDLGVVEVYSRHFDEFVYNQVQETGSLDIDLSDYALDTASAGIFSNFPIDVYPLDGNGWGKMHFSTAQAVLRESGEEVDNRTLATMLAVAPSAIDLIARYMQQAAKAYAEVADVDISHMPDVLAFLYHVGEDGESFEQRAREFDGTFDVSGSEMATWVQEQEQSGALEDYKTV